jgi:hypothetical protein
MNTYIPKQPKQIKERIEVKLDVRLIQKLERYCEYLDSDRDYVISKALEIAFKKEKGFADWFSRQPAEAPAEAGANGPMVAPQRGRKPARIHGQDDAGTNTPGGNSSAA